MKPYVLAVKAVIINERHETLLVRRSSANRLSVGCWEWPGGKVDPGEDFAAAVIRETREETGFEVEITALVGATEFEMPALRVVLLCMEARITGGEITLSHEHDAWEWVPLGQLADRPLIPVAKAFMCEFAARRAKSAMSQ